MTLEKPPLHVLILSDGRPGHYRQSEGIALALSRLYDVRTRWAETVRRTNLGTRAVTELFRFSGPLRGSLLAALYEFRDLPKSTEKADAIDVIVSAGGATLMPNVMLARQLGCKNIFSGSLRHANPQWLTASLTNYPEAVTADNIVFGLKPNAIDMQSISFQHNKSGSTVDGFLTKSVVTVFIGGNAGTHRFTYEDWSGLIKLLIAVKTHWGLKARLVTSPRTGRLAEDLFGAAQKEGIIDDYHPYGEVGAQPLIGYVHDAELILCTEDSNSMLTEAICSGRKVVALQPAYRRLSDQEQSYLDWLEEQNWMRSLRLVDRDIVNFDSVLKGLVAYKGDHLMDLAKRLQPFLSA